MPILLWNSSIRARVERTALKLDISYQYQLGDSMDATYNLRKPLPACVDVISCSDLIFSVSAVVDRCRWSGDTLRLSLIPCHLVQYLRLNARVLSINHVSDPYVDEDDGNVKINLTPGRPHVTNVPRYSVRLASVHLTYTVRLVKPVKAEGGKQTVLTLKASVLNGLMDRFVMQQLVKLYPLIFGPMGEKLVEEELYFRSIAQSLLAMMKRSPNSVFRQRVQRHINGLRKRLRSADHIAMKALRNCCDSSDGNDFNSTLKAEEAPQSDEVTIAHAMQRLFKLSVRRPRVKGQPVSYEPSDLGFQPASVDMRCSVGAQGTGDSPMNLMFSDEDEDYADIQDTLEPLLDWWALSGTPLSPSEQETPSFSDMGCAVEISSWTRLDPATSTSANLDCKHTFGSDSDVLSSSPAYFAHVRNPASSAVRPDLDLHSHSEDDSDEDSLLNLSSKKDCWHQDLHSNMECSNSPVADQVESVVNCSEQVSCLDSPLAKVKPSGERLFDELDGLHEPTAESDYELYSPSNLVSCENTCSGANRVLSRPTSLHFSNDNSRSSSPIASLPELTEHNVPPGVAHVHLLASAPRHCTIDYALERLSPSPPWSSLDSGHDSGCSQSLCPGTDSHADLLAVPGLDRSDETEDDFDACEWEARGAARTQAFPSGFPIFRCEEELGELGDFYEHEHNVAGTFDLGLVPGCVQGLPQNMNAQNDASLHFDFDSDELDEQLPLCR